MSLNINALASRVAAVGVTASQAVTIVNEVVSLIGLAENLYEGVKGSAKFQAVMAGLEQVVAQLGISDKLAAIKAAVGPMVNLVVSILNAGDLWSKVFGAVASFAQAAAQDLAGIGQSAPEPAPAP